MRLWHKDLIKVLPRQQLFGQWRECCCIARNISINNTPNHILVNKIMNYPISHFWKYGFIVMEEIKKRGFNCDFEKFQKWLEKPQLLSVPETANLFEQWHNNRYLTQCFYNLQEKYDCGGISKHEWKPIENYYSKIQLNI